MRRSGSIVLLTALVAVIACENSTDPLPLDTPADVTASVNGATATVSWKAVEGVEAYVVDLTADTEAKRSQTVTSTTATFTNLTLGVTYHAAVAAQRGSQIARAPELTFIVPNRRAELIAKYAAELPTSVHGTAKGMEYWYNQADGYGKQIGVEYSTLECKNCHVYNTKLSGTSATTPCLACHPASAADPLVANYDSVSYAKCMGCHSRQGAEIAMNLPDVHRAKGMNCGSCHNGAEIHGGADKNTMLETLSTQCQDCHKPGGTAPVAQSNASHNIHGAKLACQTCHMTGSVTCYNCHFNDEIVNKTKTAYKRFADWLFLGNYRGKVYPLNFQSVEYKGETFNAWGPFHGHTITADGRACNACHNSANVQEYFKTGKMVVTKWDEPTRQVLHMTGVIPVPADYASSLSFDYVTKLTGGAWSFVETGPDRTHMLYATPLTAGQMAKIRY